METIISNQNAELRKAFDEKLEKVSSVNPKVLNAVNHGKAGYMWIGFLMGYEVATENKLHHGPHCEKCGNYLPGHATGAGDICTCEPITT